MNKAFKIRLIGYGVTLALAGAFLWQSSRSKLYHLGQGHLTDTPFAKGSEIIYAPSADSVTIGYPRVKERRDRNQDTPSQIGPRDPFVVHIERLVYPQYGDCGKCGRPWNCCVDHTVMFGPLDGCFALCEDCWHYSSLAERKEYFAKLYREQVKQGMKDDHYQALMDSIIKHSNQ